MTKLITATGIFKERPMAPSVTVTSGRGNTNRDEVHLQIRVPSADGETHEVVAGWFDAEDLVDAIVTHSGTTPPDNVTALRRITEPASDIDEAA